MNLKNFSRAGVCLLASLLAPALGAAVLGSQTILLSTTPTALSCSGQRYVNKLTIRVLPGFEGKVYPGFAGMVTATYANMLSILFPNAGAHSEEYAQQDESGDDGIDLCSVYVAGAISGERAIAEYQSNGSGTTAPTYLLIPSYSSLDSGVVTYTNYANLRAQVIPGYSYPGPSSFNLTDLNPNNGVLSQHNAWSEFWRQSDPLGANGLYANELPISNGPLLVSGWQKKTSTGTLKTSTVAWEIGGCFSNIGTGVDTVFDCVGGGEKLSSYTSGVYNLHFKVQPRASYWPKVDIQDASGNLFAVLWPNTTYTGFSEQLGFGVGAAGSTAYDVAAAATAAEGDFIAPTSGASSIPTVLSTVPTIKAGSIGSATPVSIGRGNVKKLRVQVTPAGEGKIYLGTSSMNIATGAGVCRILFPNTIGRMSETVEIEDVEGDGVPTNSLYIQAAIAGEQAIVYTASTGITPADGVLKIKDCGEISGSGGSYAVPVVASSTPSSIIQLQAIPGGEGKLWIGTGSMTAAQPDATYANVLKVLWPSEGNYNVGEGWSETFIQSCKTGPISATNCLDLHNLTFWPYISTEQLLVFALGR